MERHKKGACRASEFIQVLSDVMWPLGPEKLKDEKKKYIHKHVLIAKGHDMTDLQT